MLKKKKYPQQQSNTNPYFKQRPNINKIIEKTKTTLNDKPKTEFQKPKTLKEWQIFHKTKDGMKKAYEKPEGYHIEGNKLYIAGNSRFYRCYGLA